MARSFVLPSITTILLCVHPYQQRFQKSPLLVTPPRGFPVSIFKLSELDTPSTTNLTRIQHPVSPFSSLLIFK